MLYFNWLQQGYDELPGTDDKIRDTISERMNVEGLFVLHEELLKIDPKVGKNIHHNDKQRIQRALSIYYSTGKTPSQWYSEQEHLTPLKKVLNLIISSAERKLLHQRIERRFDQMLEQGFIAEVEKLYQRGDLSVHLPSMKTVGYRQIWSFLNDEYNFSTMRDKAIIATRQLAKRQLIWLRRWDPAIWFDCESINLQKDVLKVCKDFL